MKKKLKISEIKIQSFITDENINEITDEISLIGCIVTAVLCSVTCHSNYPCGACGAGGTGCFLDNTLINVDSKRYLSIQELKVGDKVLSFNEKKRVIELSKVINLYKTTQPFYHIINGQIKTTAYHPFLVNGEWKEVRFIKIGDVLKDNLLNDVIVESIKTINEEVPVYNLEVEKNHTFFAHNILVHNKIRATGPNCGGGNT